MLAYLDNNNVPQAWNPAIRIDGVYYSPNVEDLWTAAQLTAVGLYPVKLFTPPPGEMVTPGAIAIYALSGPPRTADTTVIQTYPTEAFPPVRLPPQAANDVDAAAAGVPVGGQYCAGSQLMMRQS